MLGHTLEEKCLRGGGDGADVFGPRGAQNHRRLCPGPCAQHRGQVIVANADDASAGRPSGLPARCLICVREHTKTRERSAFRHEQLDPARARKVPTKMPELLHCPSRRVGHVPRAGRSPSAASRWRRPFLFCVRVARARGSLAGVRGGWRAALASAAATVTAAVAGVRGAGDTEAETSDLT